ncbi:oxygenase MpaB family protein [Streptomyces sp. NPDC046909]|uniref:oxygenase MpaB family protein n=1 Tax=Streptomyces sp. NPDC046909 TaxID=3155617 RepID=UPI0033E1ECA4
MTTPPASPEHMTDPAHPRPDARKEQIATMLAAGDPLADAVTAELDHYGTPARQALETGLRQGLTGLAERPPRAVATLLEEVESATAQENPLKLRRGDVVSMSVPPMWFGLCSVTSALAQSYSSPATARVVAGGGTSTARATCRLSATGVWARQVMRPGGLLRGAPGYVATVGLRLRHARMRAASLTDWDRGTPGLPVGQLDLTRTWLGFTFTSFQALAMVGVGLSTEQEHDLYAYWSHVGRLLGIDERLRAAVNEHADARRLLDLLRATTAGPDENSTALTAALVDAQARATAAAPGVVLSEAHLCDVIHGLLRRALGDDTANRLNIPAASAARLTPLIRTLDRQARHTRTGIPASSPTGGGRTSQEPGSAPTVATLPLDVTSGSNACVDHPNAPAA